MAEVSVSLKSFNSWIGRPSRSNNSDNDDDDDDGTIENVWKIGQIWTLVKKSRKHAYDRIGNTSWHKCHAKGNSKDTIIQEITWNAKCTIISVINRATERATSVLKKCFGSHTRKTFNRFATNEGYTWNFTYYEESTAICNLKSERWVQRRIIT
jgi:hypothetical protein